MTINRVEVVFSMSVLSLATIGFKFGRGDWLKMEHSNRCIDWADKSGNVCMKVNVACS